MKRVRQAIVLSAIIVAGPVGMTSAAGADDAAMGVPFFLAKRLPWLVMATPKLDREGFAEWAAAFWAQLDRNGDGVTRDEIHALLYDQPRAERRQEFRRADRDGDGKIDQAEVDAALETEQREWEADPKRQVFPFKVAFPMKLARARWEKADANGDSVIDAAEIDQAVEASVDRRFADKAAADYLQVFALDPNRDDRVTTDEIETLARALFDFADVDHDGRLEPKEMRRISRGNAKMI
jgi:hypothetical protein